jgi:hypothetical protein
LKKEMRFKWIDSYYWTFYNYVNFFYYPV